MVENYFKNILIATFQFRVRLLFILALLLTACALVRLVRIFLAQKAESGKKRGTKNSQGRGSNNNFLLRTAIGYGSLIILFCTWAISPYLDAQKGEIIELETIYCREAHDYRRVAPNIGGRVSIVRDNKEVTMELYPGFSDETFPEGTFPAKVWYGKTSEVILHIEPIHQ